MSAEIPPPVAPADAGTAADTAPPPSVRRDAFGTDYTEAAPAPSSPNWADMRHSLSQEIQDAPYMQNHESFEDFARDAISQNRLVGFEKIARPKEDGTPEDWNLFYDSMGRPATPQEYQLGDFHPPENVQWDGELQSGMLEDFHRAGLSQKQVNEVVRAYAQRQSNTANGAAERKQAARAETTQKLKDAWGPAWEARAGVAQQAMEYIFGENLGVITEVDLPDGMKLGNHPAIIEAMYFVGQKMQEAQIIGEKQVSEPSLAPAEAQRKADEMMADPAISKILASGNLESAEVKRWNMLMDLANPG